MLQPDPTIESRLWQGTADNSLLQLAAQPSGLMEAYGSFEDMFEQFDSSTEQHAVYKRTSWPATAVLQRPAPPPRFLAWFDSKMLAAVVSMLLVCSVCTSMDYGAAPQLNTSSAHLSSPSSTSYNSIAVHSTVLNIDLAAEVMLLEIKVQQQGPDVQAACKAANSAQFELAVGTAEPVGAAPAAVLPLCSAPPLPDASSTRPHAAAGQDAADSLDFSRGSHAVYTVPIPIRQLNLLDSPWEELAADVKVSLRCAGAACRTRNAPGVTWTAQWASELMQLSHERHMTVPELMLLDSADMYPIDEYSVSHMEAVGLHRPSPEAAFRIQMTRYAGVRILQLVVAVVQLCFILYCLMMGAGQVLWAYVMHRFLCMRTHMVGRRTRA